MERGQRVTELMKQAQYSPMSVAEMAVSLFAIDHGFMDAVEMNKIGDYEAALLDYMTNSQASLMETLNHGDWGDEIQADLKAACEEFNTTGSW